MSIEWKPFRYYKSVYHDPVFDEFPLLANLTLEPSATNQVMEFNNCAIHQTGMTFGSQPFSQSSNLRLTTNAINPARGSNIFKPQILAVMTASWWKSISNNNRSYIIFAIPFPVKTEGSNDIIYMVGYFDRITRGSGESDPVYYYFNVAFIKNSYDPDTAPGADFLYMSTWGQMSCNTVFTSSRTLFTCFWMEALNDTGQYIRADMEPEGWFLDKHILCFANPCVDNFNDASTLPEAGDSYKIVINSTNGAIQSVTQPGANAQVNGILMFVSPAYVEYEYNCKIDYERGYTSGQVGTASEEGGYENGTFEYEHDQISVSNKPVIGMSTSGMYHVYRVFQYQLAGIGAEIIPQPIITPSTPNTGSDVTDALKKGFDNLANILTTSIWDVAQSIIEQKLIDYVVDLHMVPVVPEYGDSDNIVVGWKTLESTAYPVSTDYVDVSCGRVQTQEFYANFADYLTRVKLFLPFIGFVPCQPEWFQNATIGVDYRFNIIDGSFQCFVTGYGSHINKGMDHGYKSGLLAQYSGTACIHMPITGTNYANMMSGAIGAGIGLAVSAGTGNLAGVATSAISALSATPEVAQSNSYSASAAILSHRKPFLMIARPTSHYAENYQHEIGIPANIYARIGDLSGFVRADDIHLENIPCTENERSRIAAALREGVIV